MIKPAQNDYPEYYHRYVKKVIDKDILKFHSDRRKELVDFFESIDEEKSKLRYSEGKWSIKEVLGHIIDAERIFACRALHLAQGEKEPLPGFDENDYVDNSNLDELEWSSLIKQFDSLRISNKHLFDSFNEKLWSRKGIADGKEFNTASFVYILTGHTEHHIDVLKERYL